MSKTTRNNPFTKAHQTFLASVKNDSDLFAYEYGLAHNTNKNRGYVGNHADILAQYANDGWSLDCGASKVCHVKRYDGTPFQTIVIKRHKDGGHIFGANGKSTGNQLIDEINCWNELAETEYADILCPILRYFTSKSDKVDATSDTMQRNVVIIAQKALHVGRSDRMCEKAEELNRLHGLQGESAQMRLVRMRALANARHWWDVMRNPGNCGVIFDYSKKCYKAVFIDYAL